VKKGEFSRMCEKQEMHTRMGLLVGRFMVNQLGDYGYDGRLIVAHILHKCVSKVRTYSEYD
jgi:hypothetical protein